MTPISLAWMRHPLLRLLPAAAALAFATGCSFTVGTSPKSTLRMRGLVNGHVSTDAMAPYDGNIVRVGVLGAGTSGGEVVSFDLWPIAGVGVGLVGVRARVLLFEVGVGTLFYDPQPPRWVRADYDDDEEEDEEEDEKDDDHEEDDAGHDEGHDVHEGEHMTRHGEGHDAPHAESSHEDTSDPAAEQHAPEAAAAADTSDDSGAGTDDTSGTDDTDETDGGDR